MLILTSSGSVTWAVSVGMNPMIVRVGLVGRCDQLDLTTARLAIAFVLDLDLVARLVLGQDRPEVVDRGQRRAVDLHQRVARIEQLVRRRELHARPAVVAGLQADELVDDHFAGCQLGVETEPAQRHVLRGLLRRAHVALSTRRLLLRGLRRVQIGVALRRHRRVVPADPPLQHAELGAANGDEQHLSVAAVHGRPLDRQPRLDGLRVGGNDRELHRLRRAFLGAHAVGVARSAVAFGRDERAGQQRGDHDDADRDEADHRERDGPEQVATARRTYLGTWLYYD